MAKAAADEEPVAGGRGGGAELLLSSPTFQSFSLVFGISLSATFVDGLLLGGGDRRSTSSWFSVTVFE